MDPNPYTFTVTPKFYNTKFYNTDPLFQPLITRLGHGEFLPDNGILEFLGKEICPRGDIPQFLCENVLFLLGGYDFQQMNAVRFFSYIIMNMTVLICRKLGNFNLNVPDPLSTNLPLRRQSRVQQATVLNSFSLFFRENKT